ncbi:MAG: acyltransferase [Acutalibacteraceae bacterium]|nr:acyltransferase [Acutalibacteraceae bacterium]
MYFKDLLRYRNAWLGCAMIWIFLFHAEVNFGVAVLNKIKDIGYGGVDICLFASGIGCYYSLTSDSDAVNFLKRRLKRIMPTYFIFIVAWLAYMFLCNDFGWRMAIGNLFAVQHLTGLEQSFNWYISAILIFYIVAPYFKRLVDKASFGVNLLVIAFLIILSIPFWRSFTYIVIATRVPIFYIGMLFGKLCKQDKKMNVASAVTLTVMLIAGVAMWFAFLYLLNADLWAYGLYWYPFILIAPPLCILVSYVARILEKNRVSKKLLEAVSLIGNYSFEVYLLHLPLVAVVSMLINRYELQNISVIVWIASLVCLAIGCFVLRKLTNLVVAFLFKKKHA